MQSNTTFYMPGQYVTANQDSHMEKNPKVFLLAKAFSLVKIQALDKQFI